MPPSLGPQVLTISEKAFIRTAVVDDVADLVDLYYKILKRRGYSSPRVFRDGFSLVDSVVRDREDYDIVLIDFQMPGLNGFEASQIVLKHCPLTKIVMISANDSIQEEALSLGLFFLQKPFSLYALEQVLNRLEPLVKKKRELERHSESP